MYYYNNYDDFNYNARENKHECGCHKYDDQTCDNNKYDNDNRHKCCWKVTEFCCYPSYYDEDKSDQKEYRCHDDKHDHRCECKKPKFDNDRCCRKERSCYHEREEKKETRPTCRPCCSLFRNWCR